MLVLGTPLAPGTKSHYRSDFQWPRLRTRLQCQVYHALRVIVAIVKFVGAAPPCPLVFCKNVFRIMYLAIFASLGVYLTDTTSGLSTYQIATV
jgi:hypothetical protein